MYDHGLPETYACDVDRPFDEQHLILGHGKARYFRRRLYVRGDLCRFEWFIVKVNKLVLVRPVS